MRRYLTLSADYQSTGIRDDFTGDLQQEDVHVSDDLWQKLQSWAQEYQVIIPLSVEDRVRRAGQIKRLDEEGLLLASAFAKELGPDVHVRYYSEGLLAFLNSIQDFDACLNQIQSVH